MCFAAAAMTRSTPSAPLLCWPRSSDAAVWWWMSEQLAGSPEFRYGLADRGAGTAERIITPPKRHFHLPPPKE
jgi:hypothetical protein